MTFPTQIIAGEILSLCVRDASYTQVASYMLGPVRNELGFILHDGGEWRSSFDTSPSAPGLYSFETWAFRGSTERLLIERGQTKILPSILSGSSDEADQRSLAQRMVDMIEAMIAGNASAGVKRYRINNRELERYSLGELMQLLNYWRNRVAIENRKALGLPALGPKIKFSF